MSTPISTRSPITAFGSWVGGLGVINYSPELKFKLGLIYLDRNDVKLLPAGGVFYTPDADTRWEIFFPRPKYTHRFATTGAYQVMVVRHG